MAVMQNWLLPEYIEDILPAEAARIEALRARLLELFRVHGYALVHPPLLEYVESLATGTGQDMDIQTFKVVDQLSGRMMGLRADISPQVARIDAHALNREGVVRLCYAGRVLHTEPEGLGRTREPFQIGAELFGHAGIESDIEIQRLLLQALKTAGAGNIHIDLGHVAIFRTLVRVANLSRDLESRLFDALQAKDLPELEVLTGELDGATRTALLHLPRLYGGLEVLAEARAILPDHADILRALDDLAAIGTALDEIAHTVCVDLGELRGYHYHSAVVFSVYAADWRSTLARGGRYDEVGKAFGRARPATGFSIDLRELAKLQAEVDNAKAILAPYSSDRRLADQIERLRASGEIVVIDLPGHEQHRYELDCNRMLVLNNDKWELVPFDGAG